MDSAGWYHLKTLFDQALALPAAEREAFLQKATDDEALRAEVLALLVSLDEDPAFLEEPVSGEALAAFAETLEDPAAGTTIGAYRLIEKIAEGGMGVVYRGERIDGQFEHQVAIKVVHGGAGRGQAHLVERFRHERQILASLQHPNIARLFDGGVAPDGRPYLVMELVDGVSIDTYVTNARLDVNSVLRLFLTVCEAVQQAHQQLVVHRDLKPSNILVTAQGHVKLLDFGIAKLLDEGATDATLLTRTGVRPMTPEYASPEQIRGGQVTTASDVYALGVTLYQLLAGRRPYDLKALSPSQVERLVCEDEPPRPSTVPSGRQFSVIQSGSDKI